jgi:hypothetical protein
VTEVSIGPTRWEELPQILELLDEADLPQDGLESHLSTTLVAASRDASWVARASSSTNPQPCCGRSP